MRKESLLPSVFSMGGGLRFFEASAFFLKDTFPYKLNVIVQHSLFFETHQLSNFLKDGVMNLLAMLLFYGGEYRKSAPTSLHSNSGIS